MKGLEGGRERWRTGGGGGSSRAVRQDGAGRRRPRVAGAGGSGRRWWPGLMGKKELAALCSRRGRRDIHGEEEKKWTDHGCAAPCRVRPGCSIGVPQGDR
jgi:hypothetical protein